MVLFFRPSWLHEENRRKKIPQISRFPSHRAAQGTDLAVQGIRGSSSWREGIVHPQPRWTVWAHTSQHAVGTARGMETGLLSPLGRSAPVI